MEILKKYILKLGGGSAGTELNIKNFHLRIFPDSVMEAVVN